MPARIIIPKDTRFGKLVVQGPAPNRGKFTFWKCLCDCGNETEVRGSHLRSDATKSCGECPRESKSITHGMTDSPEFSAWKKIKGRCLTPTDAAWERYGGRGIKIYEPWINDFMAFYNHIGPRPAPELTVERIDNEKGYEPGNVKWDTRTAQARNRRSNRLLTLNGRTLCVAEWAEILPINALAIYARKALGWTDERALTQPLRSHPTPRKHRQLKLVV